jgi:hypothetical protein
MKSLVKSLVLIASLGLALGACSYKSETVVQKPVPVAASSSTTYVTPDSSSPTGASATTVYHN